MRSTARLLLLSALAAAGCLPQASLHPFVQPERAVEVPEVVGRWSDSLGIVRDAASAQPLYVLSEFRAATDTTRYRLRFARLSGRLFADVTIDPRSLRGGSPEPWCLWPVHAVLRVDAAGDSLRLAFLDDGWVEGALKDRRIRVRHEVADPGILLTEGTPGLQRLLARIANERAAFDTTAKFARRLPD